MLTTALDDRKAVFFAEMRNSLNNHSALLSVWPYSNSTVPSVLDGVFKSKYIKLYKLCSLQIKLRKKPIHQNTPIYFFLKFKIS